MDPLSVTSSVIAVLDLTTNVFGYLNSVKDASKERRQCAMEVLSTLVLLTNLRYRLEESSPNTPWVESVCALGVKDGPLDQYSTALEELQTKLGPAEGFKKAAKSLTWKLSRSEVDSILSRIERLKSSIQIALEFDHFTLSQSTHTKADAISKDTSRLVSEDEKEKILKWLTPIEYISRQSEILKRSQAGTGKWFLRSRQFQNFLDGSTNTLFCPGIPGAGKTIMSSLVVSELWRRFPTGDRGIASIFFDYKKSAEQTLEYVFAGILKQLVQAQPGIHESVDKLYERHHRSMAKPTVDELTGCLSSMARDNAGLYLVLDALDECSPVVRKKLLVEIGKLQSQRPIQLMATSRPLQDIEASFTRASSLEIKASEDDVRLYVEQNLDFLDEYDDGELEKKVADGIVEATDGMFLLARLHLDSLDGNNASLDDLEEALKHLPKGSEAVSKAYDGAIERIDFQKPRIRDLARQLIYWITLAKEPLSVQQLEHALAIESGVFAFNQKRIPKMKLVVSACAGLVAMETEHDFIRPIHYTTQEYFEEKVFQWIPNALEDMTNKCLTCLMIPKNPSGDFDPLSPYAARYWNEHAQGIQTQVKDLALQFLTSKYIKNWMEYLPIYEKDEEFTGLHIATLLGLSDIVAMLLQDGHPVNSRTNKGRTPLALAAGTGHVQMVELLLAQPDVDPNSRDSFGRTPLFRVALKSEGSGNARKITALLLKRDDVDPNARNLQNDTLLSCAVSFGHTEAIKLILSRSDTDPNQRDEFGKTPLSKAAMFGDTDIIRLFLGRPDIDTNTKDHFSRTPLVDAASSGYKEAVELLLSHTDIDVNETDNAGCTALMIAEREGEKEIVELLLCHGAKPTQRPCVDTTFSGEGLNEESFGEIDESQYFSAEGSEETDESGWTTPA